MKKKLLGIISIVLISVIFVIAIVGIIDFNRAMNGKNIIFPLHSYVKSTEYNNEGIENGNYSFNGIGYKISGCNQNDYNFHFGNKSNKSCFNDTENNINNMADYSELLGNENKIIATDRCIATYSTDPYEADKCIYSIFEITFVDEKVDYLKIINKYHKANDAHSEYVYELRYWNDVYASSPKPKLDNNKLITEGSINAFSGYKEEFEGLTKEEIKELLIKAEYEIY